MDQMRELPIKVMQGKFEECIAASDAAIVASGTASLQAGLSIVPYVLIYRVSPISFWIAQKLALVPFLGILNLLAKKQVVKELLQDDFTPENLIKELRNIKVIKKSDDIDLLNSSDFIISSQNFFLYY